MTNLANHPLLLAAAEAADFTSTAHGADECQEAARLRNLGLVEYVRTGDGRITFRLTTPARALLVG